MLLNLSIQNLILIESVNLSFGNGLNIITGESGSGKSILLQALSLLFGEKGGPALIRKGSKRAVVEGTFHISPSLKPLFDEYDLDFSEECIVRREISSRSRVFINDQMTDFSFLALLGKQIAAFIDQNAKNHLTEQAEYRKIIDSFYDLTEDAKDYSASFHREKELVNHLEEIISSGKEREKKALLARDDLEEIERVNLKENELEELEKDHHLLSHSQNILEQIETALPSDSLLSELSSLESLLVNLESITSDFSDPRELAKNARLELDEIHRFLIGYKGKVDLDSSRLISLEERLGEVEKLKRRFGMTFEEIQEKKGALEKAIHNSQNDSEKIEEVKREIEAQKIKTNQLAAYLTKGRKESASLLEKKILAHLRELGLEKAQFQIDISKKSRSSFGEDDISFLFSANLGEEMKKVKDAASGGELSRLLLAIRTSLAEKDACSLLICDEIDANVGGGAASLIAEKLSEIAKSRQIICVTHFVQVARSAMNHFAVRKESIKERSQTLIEKLDPSAIPLELSRMTAGSHST